jgi:Ca-activated chloride channel homolog
MHTRLVILRSALIFSMPGMSSQAPLVVHGRVSDASTGKPIPGTVINLTESRSSASTDAMGQYRLVIETSPPDTIRLIVRRIGYSAATSSIAVGGRSEIVADFALRQSSVSLESVVTTGISGYATLSRRTRVRAPATLGDIRRQKEPGNTESYDVIDENPFLLAIDRPLSTFSVDVDRASK